MSGFRIRVSLFSILIITSAPALCIEQSPSARRTGQCGEVVSIPAHDGSTMRYAYLPPPGGKKNGIPITLALFPGGSGHVKLDNDGCPQALQGNSLVRSIPIFGSSGFGTALVDAPSDHHGEDGLGGFRIDKKHAEDIGKVIADLRARTKGTVWLVGSSRGTISVANAAARLSDPLAPEGVVLKSALMSGDSGANKAWVAQSVFDLPLESIRVPVLVVGHAADQCVRSPAKRMPEITARTNGVREQVVTVTGGPGSSGGPSLAACQGRKPHGFIEQEAEVAAGMARFIRGGNY